MAELTPLQFLNKTIAAFNLKYKNKIMGEADSLYAALTPVVTDSTRQLAVKNRRIQEKLALKTITDSGDDADTKAKNSAEARIAFLNTAIKEVKAVSSKVNSQKLALAVSKLAQELSTAVTEYMDVIDTNNLTAQDTAFLNAAQRHQNSLNSLVTTLKGRLRHDGQIFNANINTAGKTLNAVRVDLTV